MRIVIVNSRILRDRDPKRGILHQNVRVMLIPTHVVPLDIITIRLDEFTTVYKCQHMILPTVPHMFYVRVANLVHLWILGAVGSERRSNRIMRNPLDSSKLPQYPIRIIGLGDFQVSYHPTKVGYLIEWMKCSIIWLPNHLQKASNNIYRA